MGFKHSQTLHDLPGASWLERFTFVLFFICTRLSFGLMVSAFSLTAVEPSELGHTVSALIKRYIVITVVENVGKSEDGMFYCW